MTGTAAEWVRQLDAWLDGTDILLLELVTPQDTIRLRRDGTGGVPAAPATSPPAPEQKAARTVAAPSVGVFLHRHPLRAAPLARPGQAVRQGDVLGLLRIGALLLDVEAPCDGVVLEVLAADGATVGYGTPLLRLAEDSR